ncbi:hypothetical protein D0Y83_04480 [Qipengyuania flava]|uniref:Uncharacterized protein n=1 Tax=Qipengyuania flava TaxID=192812 RepID=A0A5P6N9B9_9SPHN|nr:hypothetical protein D0Y83_04480 [Qipengyuania flava]
MGAKLFLGVVNTIKISYIDLDCAHRCIVKWNIFIVRYQMNVWLTQHMPYRQLIKYIWISFR